jgi:hypothetical protein
MDLNDYDEHKRVKAIVFGPPKVGKTALLAALAEAGFTLWWFDMENGIKTLLNPQIMKVEARKNVRVFNIPDHRGYPIAIDVLREIFKGGKKKFCCLHGKNMCPVCAKDIGNRWSDEIDLSQFTDRDILVVDSWTQVANSAANKVTLKEWNKDPDYKMTFDDYRLQGMYQDEILTKMQVANIHIAVLTHETDVEKSESKEKLVPNGGTRNFSKTIAKYFDECIYLQVQNKKHSVYSSTTFSNTVLTGGRSGIKLEEGSSVSIVDVFGGGRGI